MKRYQSLLLLVCALAFICGCKRSDPNASVSGGAQIADNSNYELAEPIKLTELQTEQEYRDFLDNNEIAVVKFGAQWCPPCRQLDPELEKIAGYFQTENVAFATVDVDDFKSLAASLGVSRIPDTRLYYNSAFYSNVLGCAPREIASLVASVCQTTTTLKEGDVTNTPSDAETFAAYDDDEEIDFDENSYPEFDDPVHELFVDVEPGNVTSLSSVEELENFVKENSVAVVKFGAKWCPPCRKLDERAPLLAGKFPNVAVGSVDIDEVPAFTEHFGSKPIPVTIVFVGGALRSSCVGCLPEKIVENIEAGLALAAEIATVETETATEPEDAATTDVPETQDAAIETAPEETPSTDDLPALDVPETQDVAVEDASEATPSTDAAPALDASDAETPLLEENE